MLACAPRRIGMHIAWELSNPDVCTDVLLHSFLSGVVGVCYPIAYLPQHSAAGRSLPEPLYLANWVGINILAHLVVHP